METWGRNSSGGVATQSEFWAFFLARTANLKRVQNRFGELLPTNHKAAHDRLSLIELERTPVLIRHIKPESRCHHCRRTHVPLVQRTVVNIHICPAGGDERCFEPG